MRKAVESTQMGKMKTTPREGGFHFALPIVSARPGYDGEKLLKVILFAFMEEGCQATRKIKKLCRTDIRFLWLLDEEQGPSHTLKNRGKPIFAGMEEEQRNEAEEGLRSGE